MDFSQDEKTLDLMARREAFMDEAVCPAEAAAHEQIEAAQVNDAWAFPAVVDDLRAEARRRGLWNFATVAVLRTLARRARDLRDEAASADKQILVIVRAWRPDLLKQTGVGAIVAATVLCAWSHPGRIHSEAAFTMLAGVAPIPANSGQVTNRFRLNRCGDRQLNRALHTITLSRILFDQNTRDYVARRTTEGKTPREIKRCLRRYIARDLYRLLERGPIAA